ncbi:MAG: PIN domain-containing protein [Candidatus Thermoplasmatota archaeon]|nr:PIN domain-containing protein [Candidatus Thermoplasmatota archaeon]MDI6887334.1 PIN domain-containing protein [Candidatus Thermoplasmatota archaeon]
MYSCALDAHAWIAYFKNEKGADTVESYIERENTTTPIMAVAEIAAKLYLELPKKLEEALLFIKAKSTILDLSFDIAARAGRTREELRKITKKKVSLADAIVYETAKQYDIPVLTGDPHFKGLENVIYIG